MPIYEYSCRSCSKQFSKLQRIGADASGISCPNCGSEDVRRKLSDFCSAAPSKRTAAPSGCGGSRGFT